MRDDLIDGIVDAALIRECPDNLRKITGTSLNGHF